MKYELPGALRVSETPFSRIANVANNVFEQYCAQCRCLRGSNPPERMFRRKVCVM